AGIEGTVREINMSCCIIIDNDKTYVTVPNVKIWGQPIKNFSRLKKAL
ncbi:MAG: mechanosensitive ion channel, partial [Nanoarchaeota archaeon]|nr:mechanosensitive ion channel [Nanoarchaeota archaeon]